MRTFRLTEFILFPIIIFSAIAINLNGAESFFSGLKWSFLNIVNIRIISVLIIVVPSIFAVKKDIDFRKADANSLSQVVEELVLPNLNSDMDVFRDELKQNFHLENELRITLFIPCREGLFKWRIKMACFTSNVKDREKALSLSLNEGAVGFTLAAAKALNVKFINVSEPNKLPQTYVTLKGNNKELVARNIKGILVLGSFQDGCICGLLAIDTSSTRNLLSLENEDLHESALDWVISKNAAFKYLWRAKNNV